MFFMLIFYISGSNFKSIGCGITLCYYKAPPVFSQSSLSSASASVKTNVLFSWLPDNIVKTETKLQDDNFVQFHRYALSGLCFLFY